MSSGPIAAGKNSAGPGGNGGGGSSAAVANQDDDDYGQDQVKVFSSEGDGENTENELHDIKTELERDAEKAETPKSVTNSASSPTFNADTTVGNATPSSVIPQASMRPLLPQPAMLYANGSAVPFMIPPFAGGSSLYPVMRPVKMDPEWKVSQGNGTHLNLPTYSYPAGFLPVADQNAAGLRPAYPFMTIPGQYVTTQMPYQTQFAALSGSVAPNATVQPNSGGMLTPQIKDKKPHIKKPLNAFMLFMKQKRADVIKECTLKESAAINQILGKMWHALDRSEQAKYYEMAREERAKHMQMYPGWSARDNYAIHKKRRKRKTKGSDGKTDVDDKGVQEEGDNLNAALPMTLTTATSTSATPHHVTLSSTPSSGSSQRSEDEDGDVNNRKCRARFGLEQQHMWCGPCRRKKKCIRFSVGDDDTRDGAFEDEVDEDIVLSGGGNDVLTSSASSSVLLSGDTSVADESEKLPRLLCHDNNSNPSITLQTIPT